MKKAYHCCFNNKKGAKADKMDKIKSNGLHTIKCHLAYSMIMEVNSQQMK